MGNGRDTFFWEDCWIGDRPLAAVFPRLAALERNRSCTVADRRGVDGWTWEWQRPLEGRSRTRYDEMMHVLADFCCTEASDGWRWMLGTDDGFTVRETRRWIDDRVLPVGLIQTRWCDLVPRKVNIFIWRMQWQRIPTRMALSGRGLEILTIVCPICGISVENIEHLFGRCEVAASIWGLVFRWLQLPYRSVVEPDDLFRWVDECRMTGNSEESP
ncbi:hypothetical protein LXL04_029604 [Taraxacum kok-saghyz]